jgi:hypothetical protein
MLPYEIILEISNFIPLYLNKDLFLSNKFFFGIFKKKYLNNIKFIQKKYKKYRLPDKFLYQDNFLVYNDYRIWQRIFNRNNTNKIYRYIIAKYSWEYLYVFPECLLKKACSFNSSRYSLLRNWMNENLPLASMRTRKHILCFLIENRITFKEIGLAGI